MLFNHSSSASQWAFSSGEMIIEAGDGVLDIVYPKPGKPRARKVVSRSNARPTGKFPSWKMNRHMQWESLHERNAMRLLDATPAVRAFHEQPLTLHYVLHGQRHLHYPDLLVQTDKGQQLWEIKPAEEARRDEFVERTQLLCACLPARGFDYRLVVAEQLAQEPRLSNAVTLLKFGRQPVGDLERERVRQILLSAPGISWAAASHGVLGARGRAVLCRLALEGVLYIDMNRKLDGTTDFKTRDTESIECELASHTS